MQFLRPLSFFFVALCSFFLSTPQGVSAHFVGYAAIETRLVAQGDTASLHTEVDKKFALSGVDQASRSAYFSDYFSNNFSVAYKNSACTFALSQVSTSTSATRYIFEGLYTCSAAIQNITDLQIHSVAFREYLPSFDHYVSVSIQDKEWEIIFSPTVSEYPAEVAAVSTSYLQRFLAVAKQFTWMGMMHIYTGYDHILFLLSVILLMRSLKKILLLVTSFTIAHSVTLILASFNIISLPSTIVEPLIAASIAFMALRNIMSLRSSSATNPPIGERWLTTFGFGLIHGLGFASALAATSIPQEFFVPSLVIFNVGIELGQLTILAILVPALLWLDKRSQANTIFKYISYVTCALAVFWFFERLY